MTDINCVYENTPWKIDHNTRYTCVINECHEEFFKFKDEENSHESFSYERLKIEKELKNLRLKGDHKKREVGFVQSVIGPLKMMNSDVIGLFFTSCRLLRVPSNFIASNFNNLKALSIKSSKLREISREDLKPLVNLEVISFNNNNLTYLPADLFIDFKHLKAVSFARNKIKLVGLEIFDHLSELTFVDLSGNVNYNEIMSKHENSTAKDLKELRKILRIKLFENVYEVTKLNVTLEEMKKKLVESEMEIQNLTEINLQLSDSNQVMMESQQISLNSLEEAQRKLEEQKKLLEEKNENVGSACDFQNSAHPGTSFTTTSLSLQLFNRLNSNEIDPELCEKFIKNPSIFNDIANALKTEDFKDFTIKIDDENFKVHRLILAARSPVFADMMRENFSAENLSLENIPVEIFKEILRFIYGHKAEINEINAKEVFMAAGTLKMEELQNIAGNVLVNVVDQSNALEMFKLGNKYNNEDLRMKSFEKIQKYFNDKPLKAELAYDYEKVVKLIEAKKKIDEMTKELEEEMGN